jgi:formylglycine-generating enzyme required for sulfatase activity/dienelactone hydrolase
MVPAPKPERPPVEEVAGAAVAAPGPRRSSRALMLVVLLAVALAGGGFGLNAWMKRNDRVRWAREEAIPQITQLVNEEDFPGAYKLYREAEAVIPGDEKLKELWADISTDFSIETEPAGADVFAKDYADAGGAWERLGATPLDKVQVARGFKRIKVEKSGYETIEAAVNVAASGTWKVQLDAQGTVPAGMIHVPASNSSPALTGIDPIERNQLDSFFIDRYEVTNRQYKDFVKADGYKKPEFWQEPFIKDGRKLSFTEAMQAFRDPTGQPGPATWELGDYPKGQDDYPVSGVSWYEAAAYAEYAGRKLPTVYHWVAAAGTQTAKFIIPASRFGGTGPGPVSESQSLSPSGAYDMAGNVREWTANSYGAQRYVLGGAWSDQTYVFNFAQIASPFDRSAGNGFRTAKYTGPLRADVAGPIEFTVRDYSKETPVSEAVFQGYKERFAYDHTPLEAKIESRDESSDDWITEKVSFNAAYGNERVIVYLTIPKGARGPFQTVVRFPGSGAIVIPALDNPGSSDYLVKSGRVLVTPIYKGTFERQDGLESTWPNKSYSYREYVVKWVRDFMRTLDYLDTRGDIDMKRIAYYGFSWGGRMGAIIPAVDDRVSVSIVALGGLAAARSLPEVDQINFIGHVKIPVLMLNGKYDSLEPVESAQLPMYRMWGTPQADKLRVAYEAPGHSLPRNESIKDILNWLDKYLGRVK